MDLPTSNRIQRLILVAALGLAAVPGMASPVDAAIEKPTLLGFASGTAWQDQMPDFRQQAGKTPAIYQLFVEVTRNWTDGTLVNQLNQLDALGLTPYFEIHTQDLAGLNSGSFDAKLDQMGNTLAGWLRARPGRTMLITPLPEMNANHPWSGQPHGYKAGYRRIRTAFLDEGLTPEQIRFLFAPYGDSSHDDAYEDYYPGEEVVDLIGFAMINNGNPAWRDYEFSFGRYIDALRAQISLTKPILITQTASIETGPNGESRARWLDDMFNRLKAHDQVIGAVSFNRDRPQRDLDFRVLVDGRLDPTFADGYRTWSPPSEVSWIFDGRMDAWVRDREGRFAGFLDAHGHNFEAAIDWLQSEGIARGCNPPLNRGSAPMRTSRGGRWQCFWLVP